MNKNKNTQTVGAYAPQKRPLFSITTPKQEKRMELVSNAPPQQIRQEIIRNRVRVD